MHASILKNTEAPDPETHMEKLELPKEFTQIKTEAHLIQFFKAKDLLHEIFMSHHGIRDEHLISIEHGSQFKEV